MTSPTLSLLLPLLAFCFVTSVTPGPNNLMLMTSGANFGFRSTLPHMFGIAVGFTAMVALVGFGLMGIFAALPALYAGMKAVALGYMLWLAWKFANAGPPGEGGSGSRPLTFAQAAAFQWVNPKAWAMALGAITAFAPDRDLPGVLLVAGVFGAVNLPTITLWTLIGREMRRMLTSPGRLRAFNWIMAGLLVLSLWPVLAR
ncbi:MAG: LysE family translocator [Pseudomonadota bacterium]|jgi:threonine/homoserine/homoserine lactone efflux protein